MKLVLSPVCKENLKSALVGVKISNGWWSSYSNKREVNWRGEIKDFYFKEEDKKFKILVLTQNKRRIEISLKVFLTSDDFKYTSKTVREIKSLYCKGRNSDNYNELYSFLENLGNASFKIDDVDIFDDEVRWLNKHVTVISAVLPPKYVAEFTREFNTDKYLLHKNTWKPSFRMHFDTLEDIPESLLNRVNSENNPLDQKKKMMYNTSYIWKLVKNYPELFSFGDKRLV